MSCDVGKATEGLENECDVGEVTEMLKNELWRAVHAVFAVQCYTDLSLYILEIKITQNSICPLVSEILIFQ